MKSSKLEVAAVAAAAQSAEEADTAKASRRDAKLKQKRIREEAKDVWIQATKIVVPAWFGMHNVAKGLKLSHAFGPAGLLALVAVGQAGRQRSDVTTGAECEVGMQMKLRPSGFDREEAQDLASQGFLELSRNKLIKQVTKPTPAFEYGYYVLTKKGQDLFDLIEKSAGCATANAKE